MAGQYKQGTANVTNGSNQVTGVGVDWTEFSSVLNEPYPIFVVRGRPTLYPVVSAAFVAGQWTLTLQSAYVENTASNVEYAIVKDFTPYTNLPLLARGDIETAAYFSRAMTLIDESLQTVGNNDPTWYTQDGHGFQVGTLVTAQVSGGGYSFIPASSANEATARIIGMVSQVSGSQFRMRQQGLVTGIAQTLTPGSLYFVSNTGAADNLVLSGSLPATALKIPALYAVTANSGFLLPLNASDFRVLVGATNVLPGQSGLVPTPVAGDHTKVLFGDGTWKVPSAANNVLFSNLDAVTPFSTQKWLTPEGTDSPYNALFNLDTRLRRYAQHLFLVGKHVQVSSEGNVTITPAGQSFFEIVVPSWATRMKFIMVGGGSSILITSTPQYAPGANGAYGEGTISVVPDQTLGVQIGVGGVSSAINEAANSGSPTFITLNSVEIIRAQAGTAPLLGAFLAVTAGIDGTMSPAASAIETRVFGSFNDYGWGGGRLNGTRPITVVGAVYFPTPQPEAGKNGACYIEFL